MSKHLWKLLRLKPQDGDLWRAYRKVYFENYVRGADGQPVEITDWHGRRVVFGKDMFKHAFTQTARFREGVDHDPDLSEMRAQRLLWIREVLQGTAGTIKVYREMEWNNRGERKRRRVYFVVEELYVVVLDDPEGEGEPYYFVSAFPTNDPQYERKIKAKPGVLLETRQVKPEEAEEGK